MEKNGRVEPGSEKAKELEKQDTMMKQVMAASEKKPEKPKA